MHTRFHTCWQTMQTPPACSLYIVQEYQAAPCFPMFVSIYMSIVCASEWVCELCVSMCRVCWSMSAGMWVHSHVWGGTLTQARCVKHFLSPSIPLFLPSYRRLEGGSEGGRCRKVGGRERGRSANTHQSLNKHLKTSAENLPGRLCMPLCIYISIKIGCAYRLYCQSERYCQSNKHVCGIIHEKTRVIVENTLYSFWDKITTVTKILYD